MKLSIVTTNEQQGDVSVETVGVFDGDKLVATVQKRGSNPAEIASVVATQLEAVSEPIVEAVKTEVPAEETKPMSKRIKIGD